MEQNFQTSFIPKKPIVEKTAVPSQPINLFSIIGIFILFAVLLATGGLYFYKTVLTKQITQMQTDLDLAKSRFEPSKITELKTLDRRLNASAEILNNQITKVPIFKALQDITMKTVRYTKFGYSFERSKDNKVAITMSGVAVGYRSVALQSDLFGQNKNFIDPIFSNLTLDDKGNVSFDLNFSVDPSFVNYKQQIVLTQN